MNLQRYNVNIYIKISTKYRRCNNYTVQKDKMRIQGLCREIEAIHV